MFSAESIIYIFEKYSSISMIISLVLSVIIAIVGVLPSIFVTAANIVFLDLYMDLLYLF